MLDGDPEVERGVPAGERAEWKTENVPCPNVCAVWRGEAEECGRI